jgi:hypothetical protein
MRRLHRTIGFTLVVGAHPRAVPPSPLPPFAEHPTSSVSSTLHQGPAP